MNILKNCGLIIFDWDGTLADTNFLIVENWHRKLMKHDIIIPRSTILDYVISKPSRIWALKLIKQYRKKLTLDELINTKIDYFFTQDYDRVFPIVPKLFKELKKRNIKIAIGTNGSGKWIKTLLKRNKISHLVDIVVGGADICVSKPDPRIFSSILDIAGVSNKSALVVGDSIVDILAARKLNIRCITLLTGGASYNALKSSGSMKVYKDIKELFDKLD